MHHLLDINNLISAYGYLGIFVIVFFESGLIFFLPGDSLLFTAGIIASTGGLAVGVLIPIIFVATFFGGLFGYWIGVNLERLRGHSFFKKFIKDEHIEKTHAFFVKYGRGAVVFSRFVPIVRTFLPIVAGMARMNKKEFLTWSVLSSVLWPAVVVSLGFFLGRSFPWIENYMGLVIAIVVLLSFLPAVFHLARHKS
ncbi:MAG TPA: DedA family protein [Candidatus Paceibacterota bacterium]|jgi:membrane-associated protein|nr:DedA family protein [Candidatus Paceibacterota bacterium]